MCGATGRACAAGAAPWDRTVWRSARRRLALPLEPLQIEHVEAVPVSSQELPHWDALASEDLWRPGPLNQPLRAVQRLAVTAAALVKMRDPESMGLADDVAVVAKPRA